MKYLEFRLTNEFEFGINEGEFVSFMGKGNSLIIDSLLFKTNKGNVFLDTIELSEKTLFKFRRSVGFVLNKDLDIFVGETVKDEMAFGLENLALKKDDILNIIASRSRQFNIEDLLLREPNSLGTNDKVKMKIANVISPKPKVIVLDNILSELDYNDFERIVKILKEFVKNGGIVLNFTSDVEETLFSDRLIITDTEKVIVDDKVLKVLNEEKLMKRLELGLPFIVEFNKYLMDYDVVKKYETNMKKLVGLIWK